MEAEAVDRNPPAADGDSVEAQAVAEDVVSHHTEEDAHATPAAAPPKKKKRPKKRRPDDFDDDATPKETLDAASEAHVALQEYVTALPVTIGETQVRSFGRVLVEPNMGQSTFSTNDAIYPIGFSCNRYDYSPIHGRTIKLRCDVLDGRRVKDLQAARRVPVDEDIPDGPLFRVSWGRGIDEDPSDAVEYPYDPMVHSMAQGVDDKMIELPEALDAAPTSAGPTMPEVGMRVKVRFDNQAYFYGTVTETESLGSKQSEISIQYEDGTQEKVTFPDPDVEIDMPGNQDSYLGTDGKPELTELHGKPVTSVVGKSPMDAWGKVLVGLGMIDEIMMETGLDLLNGKGELNDRDARYRLRSARGDIPRSSVSSLVETSPPASPSKDEFASDIEIPAATPSGSMNGGDDQQSTMSLATSDEAGGEEKKEATTPDTATAEDVGAQAPVASDTTASAVAPVQDDREPETPAELQAKESVQALEKELATLANEGGKTALSLIDARIRSVGMMLCNPFNNEKTNEVLSSWLAVIVKKEKARVGNRKKALTAVDILDRNDSFYNPDVEFLIEGLPGTDFCSSYVFSAFRGGNVSVSWLKDARTLRDNESAKKSRRRGDTEERRKRRRKAEAVREEKKRVRSAEDEEKRKVRAEERLEKLSVQVEERLYKEAVFQREKVVLGLARNLSKEHVRRRRAAEMVAMQRVAEEKHQDLPGSSSASPFPLQLAKIFDEDAVRVWDFMSTFQKFFEERDFVDEVPSLHSIQSAVNCVSGNSDVMSMQDAVQSLTDLAVCLCKPLAASLTRTLFASLIALQPTLQKDFGATFFNDINALKDKQMAEEDNGSEEDNRLDVLLPVNAMTWQEVARVAFLSDALGELGNQRHEIAHILRGYRSAGHPHSKEAIRLRRAEDFPVALLRQKIVSNTEELLAHSKVVRLYVPCAPGLDDKKSDTSALALDPRRQRIGLVNRLVLDKTTHKRMVHRREKYMEDALRLKEEMERKSKVEEDDDDDDDEDDEDDLASNAEVVSDGDKDSASESPENPEEVVADEPAEVTKKNPYEEFTADIPTAPDLIRRCIAVLRALCQSGPAEPFLFPVDPHTNPGYYDMVLIPMSLREAGLQLKRAAALMERRSDVDAAVEETVLQFGRNIRLIYTNCLSYANAGPLVTASGMELLRIYERLFLDWVLAPEDQLPPLEHCVDDLCVNPHPSDNHSTVLLCDSCEGRYNIGRLRPPMRDIPKGDWFCPRCVSGRWWGDLDPRVGRSVDDPSQSDRKGRIVECMFRYPNSSDASATFMYKLSFGNSEDFEYWSLEQVDSALKAGGDEVVPIRCLAAVAESPGYTFGIDHGLRRDLVPVVMNPYASDAASQVAISSSVFRDTIAACASLLVLDPKEMTAEEWLRLLVLLTMKCSSSDVISNVIAEMENAAAESMAEPMNRLSRIEDVKDILPVVSDEEEVTDMEAKEIEEERAQEAVGVVEAMAVEVIHDGDDSAPVAIVVDAEATKSENGTSAAEAAVEADPFAEGVLEQKSRQKVVEDGFAGYTIKNQIRPAVASFEEDNVTSVVDSVLPGDQDGMCFSMVRCRRRKCNFCGLTDVALGTPLVRVPDDHEWKEIVAHSIRSRRTHLIAELPEKGDVPPMLVALKVSVGDELVSVEDPSIAKVEDGGMCEFLPKTTEGFQDDLAFRAKHNMPFVTGSLVAHECCGVAVHVARKDLLLQRHKERQTELIEKRAGMSCGRTLEIGHDTSGRSFWKFAGSNDALFVREAVTSVATTSTSWHRFSDAASIASVIVSLGKQKVVADLKEEFPRSAELIDKRTWRDMIMKKHLPKIARYIDVEENADAMSVDQDEDDGDDEGETGYPRFRRGTRVYVQSKTNDILWEATIGDVFRSEKSEGARSGPKYHIDGYQVSYVGWGRGYIERVTPDRVVRINSKTTAFQNVTYDDLADSRCGLPPELNFLHAKDFLLVRERIRGKEPLPDFARVASTRSWQSSNEKIFALCKAALLAVHAALPSGCIDASYKGLWRIELARKWQQEVINAPGPNYLMRCVIMLEDAFGDDWIKTNVRHLRSCLPARWKAIAEASPSSLAIRITLLDRSIKYNVIDRKRFARKKK